MPSERYRWLTARTRPSDYFFGSIYPDFYFLLSLKNPAPVPFVTADDFARPENVTKAIEGLEGHRVRLLLWAAGVDLPSDSRADHLGPLRAYIRSHYRVVKSFPEYEAWVRVDDPARTAFLTRACPGDLSVLRGFCYRLPGVRTLNY